MPFLKPHGEGLFKFCTTVQCHERTPQTPYTFDKNCPSKWKFGTFEWLGIHKIPYIIFETTSQFFFKLPITLQCHEIFCAFLVETLYYFDESNPSKCQMSDFRFHQICTLIGSFCWKYIKFQLRKYRGVVPHDNEDWCKIWRKSALLFQNWQELGEFWSAHSKVSKGYTLIGPFREKYVTVDVRK